MSTKLRLLLPEDIDAASNIVKENYPEDSYEMCEEELRSMFLDVPISPTYWAAILGDELVGFAGYSQTWMDYNIYQIFWVNVAPKHQNNGIGTSLIHKLIGEISSNKSALMVELTSTSNNLEFYQKHFGFEVIQAVGDYYLMALHLKHK